MENTGAQLETDHAGSQNPAPPQHQLGVSLNEYLVVVDFHVVFSPLLAPEQRGNEALGGSLSAARALQEDTALLEGETLHVREVPWSHTVKT